MIWSAEIISTVLNFESVPHESVISDLDQNPYQEKNTSLRITSVTLDQIEMVSAAR
jgi:hypothetical protein